MLPWLCVMGERRRCDRRVGIGGAEATAEFVDRWRVPGEVTSKQWEERFGEYAYLPLVEQSVTDALKSAGLTITEIDHVIVTGLHTRAVAAARRTIGARPDALVDDLAATVGNTGAAHAGLMLCRRARPGAGRRDDRRRHARRRLQHVAVAGHGSNRHSPTGHHRARRHR